MRDTAVVEVLRRLLADGVAANQVGLVEQLQQQGYSVSQAKISRLLRQLGAVKVKDVHGRLVYRLPREAVPPSGNSPLSQLVTRVSANEQVIVLRTGPGAAQLIASMLDYHEDEIGILGTIAGDDTVFIVPKSVNQLQQTLSAVEELLNKVKE